MLKTVLKFVAQLFIARLLRGYMQGAETSMKDNARHHFSAVKDSVAALAESHATLFKAQFHSDMKRIAKSLFGLTLIFFALLCSGFTALMWLFATVWHSTNRDIILGTVIILPVLIAIGIFFAIRHSWKKQPLFAKSMLQIENDWQVLKHGLDGAEDRSDDADRPANP